VAIAAPTLTATYHQQFDGNAGGPLLKTGLGIASWNLGELDLQLKLDGYFSAEDQPFGGGLAVLLLGDADAEGFKLCFNVGAGWMVGEKISWNFTIGQYSY
jgi:hypothetical protein